jgi:2-phosphosulfolactate phosphatase
MPAPDLPPPPTFDVPRQRPLHVHVHALRVAPEELAGCVVVVIDAIRASVTITRALAEGAASVVPVLTADDARAVREQLLGGGPATHANGAGPHGAIGAGGILLGGERGGILIPGFDLDNSPLSYTRDRVLGATIVFTTSNGTAGLLRARLASRVLVGSFANASAIVEAIADDPRPVHILCCGTRSEISLDDCLPAGAMVERLASRGRELSTDDGARFCALAWRAVRDDRGALLEAMRSSRGGRNIVRMGLGADVEYCATIDSLAVVPEFFPREPIPSIRPA